MNWTRYGFRSNYDAIILHCIAHIIVGRCRIVCQNQVLLLSPFNSDSQQIFKFSADIWITCYRWNVACIAKLSNVFSTANASLLVVDFVFKFFFFLHLLPFPLFLSKHLFSFTFVLFFINVCHYTILWWLFFFVQFPLNAMQFTRQDLTLNWTSDNAESVRFICYRYFLFAKWKPLNMVQLLVVRELLFVVTFVSSSSLLLGLHLYRQLDWLTNIPNTVVLKVHLFNFYLAHFQQANQTYKFFLSMDRYFTTCFPPSILLTLSGFWHWIFQFVPWTHPQSHILTHILIFRACLKFGCKQNVSRCCFAKLISSNTSEQTTEQHNKKKPSDKTVYAQATKTFTMAASCVPFDPWPFSRVVQSFE